MLLNVDVHGHDSHDFCDDEGEGAKIKGPAIGVAFFGVPLSGVSSVGGDINNDADDVAESWKKGKEKHGFVSPLGA